MSAAFFSTTGFFCLNLAGIFLHSIGIHRCQCYCCIGSVQFSSLLREMILMLLLRAFFMIVVLGMSVLAGCIGTDYIADPPLSGEASIEVTADRGVLLIGESLQIQARYVDQNGQEVPAEFLWSSSDESVLSVDGEGVVTAHSPGQTFLTAESADVTSEGFLMTVVQNVDMVAEVLFERDTVVLSTGDSVLLEAIARTIDGTVISDAEFSWNSADASIASVNQQGRVLAHSTGTTVVHAEAEGIRSRPLFVKVGSGASVRTGTFRKKPGTSYEVQGTAILSMDNSQLQFEEDFLCSDGPRLHVYLAERDRIEASSLDLGPLKMNSGSQDYQIPAGIRIDEFNYIIIHCVPFNVTFGFAMLTQ